MQLYLNKIFSIHTLENGSHLHKRETTYWFYSVKLKEYFALKPQGQGPEIKQHIALKPPWETHHHKTPPPPDDERNHTKQNMMKETTQNSHNMMKQTTQNIVTVW